MWKSIYKQLWNRRRSNLWIALELLLVFCLVWYIVDYFFVLGYNYSLPSHRDTNHTWQVKVGKYSPQSPAYKVEVEEPEIIEANYARIIQTIRSYPSVEEIAVSLYGSFPGNVSYNGNGLWHPDDSTLFLQSQNQVFDLQTNYFGVFGQTANSGNTSISVQDFDFSTNDQIVISRSVEEKLYPGTSAIGKEVKYYGGSKAVIVGVVDNVKRYNYLRPQYTIYRTERLTHSNIQYATISIRSKASVPDKIFLEGFLNEMGRSLKIGNFYLKEVVSYNSIMKNAERSYGMDNKIKTRVSLLVIFFLNILLCIMGTFWYRISIRHDEIGIRMALGSDRTHIRKTLIGEGIALLLIVTPLALLLEYQFVYLNLIETVGREDNMNVQSFLPDRTFLRFFITNVGTWILMASTMMIAIWIPAYKATTLKPAEALHYE